MSSRDPRAALIEAAEEASDLRLGLAVLGVLLAIYLPTATYGSGQIIDTAATAIQSWTLGERGTPELQDLPGVPWIIEVPRGEVTNRLPGAVLWGVPFYALRSAVAGPVDPLTAGDVPLWPAGLAGALATALGMAAMTVGLRRVIGPLGVAAGLTLALATPTWSVSANALWTHSVAQLGLGVVVLGLSTSRDATAGAGFLLATAARPHAAAIAAVTGLWRTGDGWVRRVVLLGSGAAAGLAIVAAYAHSLSGTASVTGLYEARVGNAVAVVASAGSGGSSGGVGFGTTFGGLFLMLVSPERGVLFYAPVLGVLLPWVRAGWRDAPPWARALAIGGLLQLTLQAMGQPIWRGGDTYFGFRLQLEALTAATPVLALSARAALARGGPWRTAVVGAAAAGVALNLLGATLLTKGAL